MEIRQFLKTFTEPVSRFWRANISKKAIGDRLQAGAEFIYKHSQDPSYVMIFFNSFAIISSHLSQIGGLKRSKRENKEYLISQEKKELALDMVLTVLPTVFLKKALDRKLLSGEWTTKSQRRKMFLDVPRAIGASHDDMYEVVPKIPIKKQIDTAWNSLKMFLAKNKHVPEKIKSKIEYVPVKQQAKKVGEHFTDVLLAFDKRMNNKAKNMRGGSALSDIGNSRNGMLIMLTLGYTIFASNVIMPILKNILANRTYRRELAEKGETPESVRRKKRFSFNENPVYNTSSGEFAKISSSLNTSKKSIYHKNLDNIAASNHLYSNSNVFAEFRTQKPSLKI